MQTLLFVFASLLSVLSHAAVDIQHWTTSSGSRVYFVENHDLPILDLRVDFPAGSAYDKKATSGLAGLTKHLMPLGAAGMNEEDITNAFADIGAQRGGSLGADRASFSLRTLYSEREKALKVFNQILHAPEFPQAVLAREKARIVAGLQEAETQPAYIANKAFMQALYGEHPYHLQESGEVDTVKALTRKDLKDFYQKHYSAQGAVIAIIGDLTNAQAVAVAEDISTGLPQASIQTAIPEVVLPLSAVAISVKHPASQAHVLLGYPGVRRGDVDYFPLYVGNYILGGGGFVSRLTEEVRDKRGLVYSVYSYFMPMQQLGPFKIGLQTKKEQTDEALKIVRETLSQFMEKGITAQELKEAKSNIMGGFPMRLDSNRKILGYLAMIGFYQLPLTYLDDFNREVNKVTAKQIQSAFNRRLKQDRLVSVIVGAQ